MSYRWGEGKCHFCEDYGHFDHNCPVLKAEFERQERIAAREEREQRRELQNGGYLGKCHHCDEYGHFDHNCPVLNAEFRKQAREAQRYEQRSSGSNTRPSGSSGMVAETAQHQQQQPSYQHRSRGGYNGQRSNGNQNYNQGRNNYRRN